MTTFRLTISASQKVLYNGDVHYCSVVTLSGKLGIESRHEPLLAVLKENSQVSCRDSSGAEESFMIGDGLLSFRDNTCVLTVSLPSETGS